MSSEKRLNGELDYEARVESYQLKNIGNTK